jgi:hypothetical protein
VALDAAAVALGEFMLGSMPSRGVSGQIFAYALVATAESARTRRSITK